MAALGVRVGSLIGLTVGDLRQVTDPGVGGEHTVLVFRRKGGKSRHRRSAW